MIQEAGVVIVASNVFGGVEERRTDDESMIKETKKELTWADRVKGLGKSQKSVNE